MSTDYYIECSVCGNDVWAFDNIDRNPQFFEVMKFIMEHSHTHGRIATFRILNDSQICDKRIDTQLGRIKPREFIPDVECLDSIKDIIVKYKEE